jgi:predicted RNase H-like HicB family nuclease
MRAMKVSVVIEKDENGYYAYSPELDGCHSQGATFEEALANVREAVELYIETLTPEDARERLSREVVTTSVEVKVA